MLLGVKAIYIVALQVSTSNGHGPLVTLYFIFLNRKQNQTFNVYNINTPYTTHLCNCSLNIHKQLTSFTGTSHLSFILNSYMF